MSGVVKRAGQAAVKRTHGQHVAYLYRRCLKNCHDWSLDRRVFRIGKYRLVILLILLFLFVVHYCCYYLFTTLVFLKTSFFFLMFVHNSLDRG
jgi:hypothetical protein